MTSRLLRPFIALAIVASLAACGAQGTKVEIAECAEDKVVNVFAASSLTKSLTAIAAEFNKANLGCTETRLTFGASSALAEQIAAGAPANIFIAASPSSMKTAQAQMAVSSVFLRNRVVVSVSPDVYPRPRSIDDALGADSGLKWIMCALEVPCGSAGKKALDADGVTSQPVSLEPDVKSVVAKLVAKEVDAAIIYHTDVVANPGLKEIEFRDKTAATTDYMLGISKTNNTAAEAFMAYLYEKFAQKTLKNAGFDTDMSK